VEKGGCKLGRRIVLIEAGAPGFHVFSRFRLPRLGLPILGRILSQDHGYDVTIFCEDIAPIDWPTVWDADIVGISSITSTAPRAYDIVKQVKAHNPDVPVIMGGPHVTFLPEEALSAGVDFVVRGEGETIFPKLIGWLEAGGEPIGNIPQLSYKTGSHVVHNPASDEARCRLEEIPWPDISLIHGHERMRIFPIQTSRGCPFNCAFCAVVKMFGRKCRYLPPDAVLDELERAARTHQFPYVFFYDDNFTMDIERTKTILRGILARKLKFHWTAQVRVEVGQDAELLDLMEQSGCETLYVGLESVNPETLKQYRKHQSVKDIEAAVCAIHRHNMKIHGMFVLGGDADTPEVIRQTVAFSLRNKIDTVQFLVLTPLPGTDTFKQLEAEGRIFNYDWSLYDAHHVVFQPREMSPWQLQFGATLEAMPRFYSRLRCWRSVLKSILEWSTIRPTWRNQFVLSEMLIYGRRTFKKWRSANREWFAFLRRKYAKSTNTKLQQAAEEQVR